MIPKSLNIIKTQRYKFEKCKNSYAFCFAEREKSLKVERNTN